MKIGECMEEWVRPPLWPVHTQGHLLKMRFFRACGGAVVCAVLPCTHETMTIFSGALLMVG